MTKHEQDIEIWKAVINRATSSGIPIRQWCIENDVTIGKYYYWHKVIADEIRQSEYSDNGGGSSSLPVIAEIRVTDHKPSPLPLAFDPQVMVARNGCQIYIGQTASKDVFQMVMGVIGKC